MSYQISVHLNDDEYAQLAAEAARSGVTIEAVAHERLVQQPPARPHSLDSRAIQQYLYRRGVVANLPTDEADTPDEEAEAERLARLFGGGKSAAEMVLEDRGPF